MKIRSPLPRRRTRIEIIPLIDIMFFLLASFMLVSLNLASAKSVKVNLPVAQTGDPENKPNTVAISVDRTGGVFLDKRPIGYNELEAELERQRALKEAAARGAYVHGPRDPSLATLLVVSHV